MSVSLLNICSVLLSYLVKTEPVCPWYNITSNIIIVRVSVALYLITDGVVSNNIYSSTLFGLTAFITPRTLCTLLINCCRSYEVNLIQTIVNKVIDHCLVTDSAPSHKNSERGCHAHSVTHQTDTLAALSILDIETSGLLL